MRTKLIGAILCAGTAAAGACTNTASIGGLGGASSSDTSTGITSVGFSTAIATGIATATTTTTSSGITLSTQKADKVDIVLGIDNSRSMADKQQILSLALADLIQSLANPPCVDATSVPVANQPATGLDACPVGSQRSFAPINDMHIGVVTTSIGGHGSDSCPATDPTSCQNGFVNVSNDDHGHLVTRTNPCASGSVPTYQNAGFLAWDPAQKDSPPGTNDLSALTPAIRDLVVGAGQMGCGYESQLESWYRFLVDPEPYATLAVNSTGMATPQGIDSALLSQRAQFLRPDSLLLILMLSDENDCSTKEFSQYWFSNQQLSPSNPSQSFYLPKARTECATNPNDPCCASTGQVAPTGCPAEPITSLDAKTDNVNLRCWDQKRRFGIDFLYPIDRYVQGLTSATVPNRAGELVPNPIFSNLNPASAALVRDPGLVILSGIVGVPWQDIARDPTDLTKGYKSAEELAHANSGMTTWDVILGDPTTYKAPLDPHMIESNAPRTGTDPLTGVTLAPPGSAASADSINGHEYTTGTQNGVQVAPNDLEYACVFPLVTPRDCSDTSLDGCDCGDPKNDNPLCDVDSGTGNRTVQARAKAYPGLRQLKLIHDLGPQGVVSSICPAQQADSARIDYAYRPAVAAILERVGQRLQAP